MRSLLHLILLHTIAISFIQAQSVSINEVLYRRRAPSEAVRFIELINDSNQAIDLSNYKVEGSIYYSFSAGTIIQANSYLVLAENPSSLQANYSIPSGVPIVGPWTGTLNLYEGEINIHNDEYCKIDGLAYSGWHEWPSSDIGSGYSIQKINPALPSEAGGVWDSNNPTPGQINSNVILNIAPDIPALLEVKNNPNRPSSNESVLITAEIINLDQINNLSVTCDYQIVDPGQYITRDEQNYSSNWQTLSMIDNGSNGDLISGDGIFTTILPAALQQDRRLVRYRIRLNNNIGFNRLYPDQDFDEANYSYYVFDSFPNENGIDINALSELQNFTLISNVIQNNGTNYLGTLVTATEVYDHVDYRKQVYYTNPRSNYRVNCNDGRPVAIQNDEGKYYKVRRDRLHFSGTHMNDKNSHGLIESIIFKVFELTGTLASFADYAHIRFVNNTNPNSDFQGIHVIREYLRNFKDFNGDFLKLRDLPDGNIHGYRFPFDILHDGDLGPYGLNNSEFENWNDEWDDLSDGCSSCDIPTPAQTWLEDNLDVDNHYKFMTAQEIIANNETNYAGQHNYIDYYNPTTDKWTVIPDDLNATFGATRDEDGFADRSDWDATEDVRGPFKVAINTYDPLRIEFENQVRSAVDLLCNTEQGAFLVENEARKIFENPNGVNWVDADKTRWNQVYSTFGDVLTDYKNYFSDRENHLANFYGSGKMPNKPSISYSGPAGYPINNLTFSNSAFSDPQGAGSFEALEWRIAEWSDPSNAVYQNINEDIYEITPIWETGEINNFSNSMTIDGSELIAGRTYRVRVRYKDNTGRKSLWSDPVQFISGPAINYQIPDLVITEILYNAADSCSENFIEIYNNGNSTADLNLFKIDGDVQFRFPAGISIGPNEYVIVANDVQAFTYKYNKPAVGQWTGDLSKTNGQIILKGLYDQLIDEVNYAHESPWPNTSIGFSIHIINPNIDNNLGSNWFLTPGCGQPEESNDILIDSDYDGIGDSLDQCPGFDDAADSDGDGIPDGCDPDADNDGVPDNLDQCPGFDDNLDVDNDNIPDGCDDDSDNDGVPDNLDQCPGFDDNLDADNDNIPDGCDDDSDNDGVSDSLDQCPGFDDNLDVDNDNIPDGCDDDSDNDGVPDNLDQCPGFDDNLDVDNDNIPNGCDDDSDNDGVTDNLDQCPDFDDNLDADNDNIPDGCDDDSDNDGVSDSLDQCPGFDDNLDADNDSIPDGCDDDSDNDGVIDSEDECPGFDDTTDTDGDNIPDGCDSCNNLLIGTSCDDNDVCTENDLYNNNCECIGIFADADSDGICDANDDDCSIIYNDDFEFDLGIWQIGGIDAQRLLSSNSPSGSYSMRIRDNSLKVSSIYTAALDLSSLDEVKITFQYQAIGMEINEDFFFEVSLDGGFVYSPIQRWRSGIEFSNNNIYTESIEIPSQFFSTNTIFRFRADGTTDSDEVYLDNIMIKSCQIDCEDYFISSSNIIEPKNQKVQIGIESNNIIPASSNIEYTAGEYITLTEGFEVKSAAVFHAYIEACLE